MKAKRAIPERPADEQGTLAAAVSAEERRLQQLWPPLPAAPPLCYNRAQMRAIRQQQLRYRLRPALLSLATAATLTLILLTGRQLQREADQQVRLERLSSVLFLLQDVELLAEAETSAWLQSRPTLAALSQELSQLQGTTDRP